MLEKLVRFVLVLAFVVSNSVSLAYAEGGLAERRAIKEFVEGKFAQVEKDVDQAAGYDIQLTADWDKLARAGEAESYNDDNYFMNTIFLPLVAALRDVAKDEMGKVALKSKLKAVHVTYDSSTAVAMALDDGLKFEGDKLTINFPPYTNADAPGEHYFKERVAAIVKALEAKL